MQTNIMLKNLVMYWQGMFIEYYKTKQILFEN